MRKDKIFAIGFVALFFGFSLTGCDSGKNKALQAQIDSLAASDSLHQEDIRQMADFVTVMSAGLDSISAQEGVIRDSHSPEGARLDKAQLRQQLNTLGELLQRQRERISQLEKEVANNKSSYGQRMRKLIAYYKAELEVKDKKIAELQEQLNSKDADIAKLNESVATLTESNSQMSTTIETQKQTMDEQQSTISNQDATIHTGFVTIGTSKQLKDRGIIKGGFLAKKKVVVSNLSASGFEKVDIRKYTDVKLNSADPKIMTQMPSGSYTLKQNGDGTSTLHISDPNLFWSVSKYLVVRL